MKFRLFSSIGMLVIVLSLGGCGGGAGADAPPLGQVTGQVMIDGSPIEGAGIQFVPDGGGRPATGVTDAQGNYTLMWAAGVAGAAVGKHKVYITTERLASSPEGDNAGPVVEGRLELLPPKYNTESELTADVASGQNTIDFPLETNGYKPRPAGTPVPQNRGP